MFSKKKPSYHFIIAGLILIFLAGPSPVQADGKPSDLSGENRMEWWREARFGMFIHWGLYAIPAGVWKGEEVPRVGEWIMYNARIPVKDYELLAGQFNPVQFDARQWVRLAKEAGMKYIVITAKHCDGFAMFRSKASEYNIVDATPFGRDVMKELSQACQEEGIRLGFYYSHCWDWHEPDALGRDNTWDFPDRSKKNPDRYYTQKALPQVRELLMQYGPVGVMWFDVPSEITQQQSQQFATLVHRLQPNCIMNDRVGHQLGDYETPEQQIPAKGLGCDWETCMTLNDTWGYKKNDHNWKSQEDLIRKLIDIASKGGNFLLNVGPTAQGLIPQPSVERLQAIGRWMKVNSDSIYGTTGGVFRYLPWGRCTRKGQKLFLHVFDWPEDENLEVPGLISQPDRAYLLSDPTCRPLEITGDAESVMIKVSDTAPDTIASVVVLEFDKEICVDNIIRANADKSIELRASDAELHGKGLEYYPGVHTQAGDFIRQWTRMDQWASWTFKTDQAGTFAVEMEYACAKEDAGSEFCISVADKELTGQVEQTGSKKRFVTQQIGTVEISKGGRCVLSVKPLTISKKSLMNLKTITLKMVCN